MDSFIKYLSYEKRYSAHTISAYETDLLQFQNHLQEHSPASTAEHASYQQVRSWVISLSQAGAHPRSINRKIASLRAYFKFLIRRGVREDNPASKLPPLKAPKNLPQFVKESEILKIFEEMTFSDDFQGFRDRVVLEMLYGTGMRLAELIQLKEGDVNLAQKTLRVFGKRSKERVLPIHHSLVNTIREYLVVKHGEHGEIDWLILTDKGAQSYPMMINRIVKKYLVQITAISKQSPHVLRHTFATHLLNKGADLNAVKDLLGHSSLAATQVYTHNSIEKLKTAFNQAHPKA